MRALEVLRDALWGWHTLLGILGMGLLLSLRTRFFQFRGARAWWRAAVRPPRREAGGVSSFQALTAALGGSLGTGNIVGVAVAISAGGPGALFWMTASAALGMMTVYGENVLAARWRGAPGPLGYLRAAGRGGPLLAGLYAGGCALSSLAMGNMTQVNACAASLAGFGVPAAVTGLAAAGLVFFVARGGLAAAVRITEKLVPAMTLLYFAAALATLWVFRDRLPGAAASVLRGALSPRAGAGGGAGALLALRVGVSRGVFTNEAGLGSSSFAYEGVAGRPPEELGCLGIFQVFLDTVVMCTVTGLCILCCRSPVLEGAPLAFFAFEGALGPWGGRVVSLCTALFALATVISWCCYGRSAFLYLTGGRGGLAYAALAAGAAFLGCAVPLDAAFLLGDAMNGLMALPNLAGLFLHRKELGEDCFFPHRVV